MHEIFDESNPILWSLQSGLVASPELVQDFVTALQDGQTQTKTIMQERAFTKTKSLAATSTGIRYGILLVSRYVSLLAHP